MNNLTASIDECIQFWTKEEGIDKIVFKHWKDELLKEIKKRLTIEKKKKLKEDDNDLKDIFKDKQILVDLEQIRDDYVVVNANKAHKT